MPLAAGDVSGLFPACGSARLIANAVLRRPGIDGAAFGG
jgi:hypothetical protein